MGFNKVILQGNLTADPATNTLPSGDTVANFSIAVNDTYADAQGQKQEVTDYIDCKAYRRNGENIAKFFQKGRPILIEGELKQEKWVDKTSNKNRSKLVVYIRDWKFVDSNRGGGPQTSVREDFSEDDLGDPVGSTEGMSV